MPNVIAVGNGLKSFRLDSLENWSDIGTLPWATAGGDRNPHELAATVAFMFRAVSLRASALADVPWAIYAQNGDAPLWESDQTVPASLSQFADLEEYLQRTEVALCLSSTAFWFKERNRVKVTGLRWLDPTTIAPHWTPQGIDYFERRVNSVTVRLLPEDVVYIWNRGIGETEPASPPAQAAMNAAQALYNTSAFVRAFFQRGAIKATLLTVNGLPLPAEKEKLKSWWQRMMTGTKNAFATEVISADVKPVVIGEGISELANTALTQELREDIATALGVPHSLVLSNASTFATAEADRLNFYDTTIIPECNRIARQVNAQLFAPLGLRFAFTPQAMNIYQENEEQRAAAFAAYVNAGMPLSVTVKLLGIDLPEGVEPEDLDPEPAPAPEPQPVALVAAAQDAAPARPQNEQDGPQGAKAIEAAQLRRWLKKRPDRALGEFEAHYLAPADVEEIVAEVKGVATEQPPFGLPVAITPETVKAMILQLDPGDDAAEQALRMALEKRTAREVAGALADWGAGLLPDSGEVAAVQAAIANPQVPQRVRDVLQRALIDAADLGVSVSVAQFGGIGFGFDYTLAMAEARAWATQYTYELVRDIEGTTRTALQEAVSRWVDNGEPLDALRRDLQPLFGKQRAQLIASTETTRAYAAGNEESMAASGVVDEMEWLTVNDERVCPICGGMNGQRRPLRGSYASGLRRPPAHPGCRCDERGVVREE